MKEDEAFWCTFSEQDHGLNYLECDRCGGFREVALPCHVADLRALIADFIREHRNCGAETNDD